MSQLRLKRLKFSKEADNWLRMLKSRTGITPNLLCRIGFCMSLEEPGVPTSDRHPEDSAREMNRYTLLGEHDALFEALLRQRMHEDRSLSPQTMDEAFRAHVHRGIILLASRLKHLSDLGDGMHTRLQS
jgi:DNA sulfur modification protein DndE